MASAIHFDPYHKWLGIPPEEQPPNHYRLLGIKVFEADTDVIQSAADQRMSHLRTFQAGAHAEMSQKILNELAAARVCLLKPSKKALYDAELKPRLAPSPSTLPPVSNVSTSFSGAAVAPGPAETVVAPAAEEPILGFDMHDLPPLRPHRAKTTDRLPVVIAAGSVVAVALVCGFAWLFFAPKDDSSVAASLPTETDGSTSSLDIPPPTAPLQANPSVAQPPPPEPEPPRPLPKPQQKTPVVLTEPPPARPQPVAPLLPEAPPEVVKPAAPRSDDPTLLAQFNEPVTGIAMAADETHAVVATLDPQNPASVWDLDERVERRRIDTTHRTPYLSVAVVPGQRLYFLGSQIGPVTVWDLREEPRATVYTLPINNGPVSALAACADGGTLAVGGRQRVEILRYTILPDRRSANFLAVTRWDGFTWPVTALAVSPEGHQVVAGCGGSFSDAKPKSSDDMKIHGFDVPSQVTQEFPGHEGSVWSMALSSDGKRLATGSSDGKVRLWDTANGKKLQTMFGHNGAALAVAISADGATVFSGGEDMTLRVWDARTGRARNISRGHTAAVRAIAYDGTRKRLVSGAQNGELRLFDNLSRSSAPPETTAAGNRAIPPSDDARATARKLVHEVFAENFGKSKAPSEKAALADTLLAQAGKSQDLAERFVLVDEARKLATSAGEVDRTLAAVREQATHFEIDTWATMAASIDELSKSITVNTARKRLAEAVLEQVDAAIAEDNYDQAKRMLATALAISKKAGDVTLTRQVTIRGREVVERGRSFETIRKATDTLKGSPDDPEANLALGIHLCFARQDWSQGLTHLAKGSDATLADAARQEAEAPSKAEDQIKLADLWWDLGGDAEGIARLAMLGRAETWYREALPQLSGLTQTKAIKRLEELTALLDTSEKEIGSKTSESSSTAGGKSLARKIKAAIKTKSLLHTIMAGRSRNAQSMFNEVPAAGLLLVGFNYSVEPGRGVISVQPIYAGAKQTILGGLYGAGPKSGSAGKAMAPPGYAVSGLEIYGGGLSTLGGLTIMYMKVTKTGLDPADTKRSRLIGDKVPGGATQTLGGDGQPIVGIFGSVRPGAWLEGLGLIQIAK